MLTILTDIIELKDFKSESHLLNNVNISEVVQDRNTVTTDYE